MRTCRRHGPGSSVGIATELRAGRSGDRIPVTTRFSAPVQTGPGAHPAYCTMGTGFFPVVKYGRGLLLTTHPFQCRGHGRVELYLYPPSGPHRACNGVTLPLPLLVVGNMCIIFVMNGYTTNYFFLRLHFFSRKNHEGEEMNVQTQTLI
jgi:hypothetical protein